MSYLESEAIFDYLSDQNDRHARSTSWWRFNEVLASESTASLRPSFDALEPFRFGPLKNFTFSYFSMGAVDSMDLFGLDELILFSFYWRNRGLYKNVVDLGANIGLHTVVLGLLGYEVTSFEPDPLHAQLLRKHVIDNQVEDRVKLFEEAVTADGGSVDFIRVLGNTTGSHVAGAKSDPYGELERFSVPSRPVVEALEGADLVKMDVEGLEADLLEAFLTSGRGGTDIICEIGSDSNAERVWRAAQSAGLNIFSQKLNWQCARGPSGLPTSYREGSVFISTRRGMPWA